MLAVTPLFAKCTFAIFSSTLVFWLLFPSSYQGQGMASWRLAHKSPNASSEVLSEELSSRDVIPNIVHYTQIQSHPDDEFAFNFENFLNVYAAAYYYAPDTIYIHTDATEEAIARAYEPRGPPETKWAHRILTIPGVQVHRVTAPTHAKNGRVLHEMAHKSDFVRMKAIQHIGGIYLDLDAHPLRDVKTLRESGFRNILGREHGGKVSNGVIMAQAGTRLMETWIREANTVFDGSWATASCDLVTMIAERMAAAANEVLILDEHGTNPTSWLPESMFHLYRPHYDIPASPVNIDLSAVSDAASDPADRWDAGPPSDFDPKWQWDLSSSYVLHAYKRRGLTWIEGFEGITPRYIMARQSNFARALYPVARHAFDAGWFTLND